MAGKFDYLPEVTLYMVGNVAEVVAKFDNLEQEVEDLKSTTEF